MNKVTIATRGSMLALWQANHIKACIEAEHPGTEVTLNVIKTQGDKILDVPLAKIGGKGLFVKEIEQALLDNEADLAVHSMKDVPMDLPEELELYVNPKPEEPNDAFLSVKYDSIEALPQGAKVGTSSLRRKTQLMQVRPDLTIEDLRGNVDTRIRKLTEGMYDAIILAKAGLKRLGLTEHVKQTIPVETMLPAVCQGILGIEIRKDDARMREMLKFLKHEDTEIRARGERAFLRRLEGGCQVPIAIYGVITGNDITMTGTVSSLDGKTVLREVITGPKAEAEAMGLAIAEKILAAGGKEILDEIYSAQ